MNNTYITMEDIYCISEHRNKIFRAFFYAAMTLQGKHELLDRSLVVTYLYSKLMHVKVTLSRVDKNNYFTNASMFTCYINEYLKKQCALKMQNNRYFELPMGFGLSIDYLQSYAKYFEKELEELTIYSESITSARENIMVFFDDDIILKDIESKFDMLFTLNIDTTICYTDIRRAINKLTNDNILQKIILSNEPQYSEDDELIFDDIGDPDIDDILNSLDLR